MVGVLGHRTLGPLQDVRRVVAHEVVQPAVVVAAVEAVEPDELVEEGLGEVAVADPELDDAEILRQGAACVEPVPHREQLRR